MKNKIKGYIKYYILILQSDFFDYLSKYFRERQKKITKKIDHIELKTLKPDPKAEKWANNNKWFGEDRIMTDYAIDVHKQLVDFEGVNPKSNNYYNELDKRIYNMFRFRFKRYFSMNN